MSSKWLFSAPVDLAAFAGTALVSFALTLALPSFGVADDTPPWAWLSIVVLVDVAHVWSTLFRTYLDRDELAQRPVLYAAAPLVAFTLGVVVHAQSSELFWRCLAYVAVWHFVRQQVGWMVLYGRRARDDEAQVWFDRVVMYAATLGPVVWWHTQLPRPFWWFREHDFIDGLPASLGTIALDVHFAIITLWLVTLIARRRFHAGKVALLLATWLSWFGGIVLAKSDLAFTLMNVTLHGVPYLVLLHRYARGVDEERVPLGRPRLLRFGLAGFLTLLWGLAFLEEFAWDRLVWHDHPMFFGDGGLELSAAALTLVVPLLSLPQTTHYLLDGFIWKTSRAPTLPRRLGWR